MPCICGPPDQDDDDVVGDGDCGGDGELMVLNLPWLLGLG